ncbi:hypothetical protein DL98DRAFT_658921 [Cadophora sp. DSE1049]|nr:hypothetical protein DL98DRAFT_658921 [Cadophora sp. DSE1049]
MESDTYGDPKITPAILFRDEVTGEHYTYKQLTFENHPFHDRRRCKLHLVPIRTNIGILELAHHITSQLATKEPDDWDKWSTPSRIKLQVRAMQVIWQGLDSGQKRSHEWAGDSEVKLCATPIMEMGQAELRRVWCKIADRGWNDRLVVTYGLGQRKLENATGASGEKNYGESSGLGKGSSSRY